MKEQTTETSAGRLAQISQGSSSVGLAYDADAHRTSLTLPNGIVVEYACTAPDSLDTREHDHRDPLT